MAVWSEINSAELAASTRLDAEYYQPANLKANAQLAATHPIRLGDIAYVTDGIHASPDVVENRGRRYLSAKCVKDNALVLTNCLKISLEQDKINKKTQLQENDILLTTVGTIGNAAVVTEDILPANIDRHLGLIRLDKESPISPYYLATFLNSRFGRFQTFREATGNVQLNLFIEKIVELSIAHLDKHIDIAELTRDAYKKRDEAQAYYEQAENLLLDALGLNNLDLNPKLYYEAEYADVEGARRFDAEYFQPAKRDILSAFDSMSQKPLNSYFQSVRELLQPDRCNVDEKVLNFDLTDALQPILDLEREPINAIELGSMKLRFQPNDIVVSRLRSYLKEIALVPDGNIKMAGSSEFFVLRPKSPHISPQTLIIFLRSPLVQTILKWCQDGSNHPRFQIGELETLPVPVVLPSLNMEITRYFEKMVEARNESRRLLQSAKQRVEQLILANAT